MKCFPVVRGKLLLMDLAAYRTLWKIMVFDNDYNTLLTKYNDGTSVILNKCLELSLCLLTVCCTVSIYLLSVYFSKETFTAKQVN